MVLGVLILSAPVPGPGPSNNSRPYFAAFGYTQSITEFCNCFSSNYNSLQTSLNEHFCQALFVGCPVHVFEGSELWRQSRRELLKKTKQRSNAGTKQRWKVTRSLPRQWDAVLPPCSRSRCRRSSVNVEGFAEGDKVWQEIGSSVNDGDNS